MEINNRHSHHPRRFKTRLFEFRAVARRKLVLSFMITAVVMMIELIGGILTNSIALISDAGHMFTHALAIVISLVAVIIARKPPCHHRTFGLYRAEILAAFINGIFLLLVVIAIIIESIHRILAPREVISASMLIVGLVGLAVNIVSMLILHGAHKHDLNIRGVFYHMAADAVSSVGIVIGAIIIHFTGFNILDPVISIGISALIAWWAWGVLRESGTILLEMAPTGLNVDALAKDLKEKFPEIKEMYNAHLWTISAGMHVFSTHITFDQTVKVCADHHKIIENMNRYLASEYNIIESTIQINDAASACEIDNP